ncbi:MAG: response regulator [Sphingobacteriaceae bacterium]
MHNQISYIIIDDDPINNMICSMTIKTAVDATNVQTFAVSEKGLIYISSTYLQYIDPTILFLDINMPSPNGWEFLDAYKNLSETIKDQIRIYMLSSSIDEFDKEKALANSYVQDYLTKPLLMQTVCDLQSNFEDDLKDPKQ